MSDTIKCCECGRSKEGGIHTGFDGYGDRKKVGLPEFKWVFCCWECWQKDGSKTRATSRESDAEISAAFKAKGLCGFLEAWVGRCTNSTPCDKHDSQRCWKCNAPAVMNCNHASMFVCGVPECAEHRHVHRQDHLI